MDIPTALQFLVLFILIFLSAFFSSAETAFSTVNRIQMRTLEEEGNKRAAKVNKILGCYSKMISTILIGNNIVNISASALATTLAIRISVPVGIATGVLTLIILLFGEIVPKTWANFSSDKLSLAYSGIIYTLMQALTPVIFIVDKLSSAILRLMGIDPNKKKNTLTTAELRTYVEVGHESGAIEQEERKMITNVFDFSDALAKDIMVPRVNMMTIDVEATYDEVIEVFRESMYTRFPVYEENKDNIIGVINIKDFFLTVDKTNFHVKDIMRDGHYTYELKKVSDLFGELRESTTSVSFVLNEYGATVGMITKEDLLEEIVGEIRDEYDADEDEFIKEVGERTYLVEASMKLDDINEELGTTLDSEDYDSIGGIIIECLQRLPEDNEEVTLENGIQLKVQGIDQNRIVKVLMTLPESTVEEEISEVSASDAETVE